MTSAFAGMRDAKGSSRGTYLDQGQYVIEVEKCHIFKTRNREELFIVDMVVAESNNDRHPVGAKRNFVQKLSVDAALPQIKQFIGACLGYEEGSASFKKDFEPECEGIAGACLAPPDGENLLKGRKARLEVISTITKEKQLPFNRHTFSPFAKSS